MANPSIPHATHPKLPWRLDPRFVIGMPLRMVDQWREREQREQKMEKETSMPSRFNSNGPYGSRLFVPLSEATPKKARPPMPKPKPSMMIPKGTASESMMVPKAKPMASVSGSHGAVRT